jgi:hypothetical protein
MGNKSEVDGYNRDNYGHAARVSDDNADIGVIYRWSPYAGRVVSLTSDSILHLTLYFVKLYDFGRKPCLDIDPVLNEEQRRVLVTKVDLK